MFEGRLPYIIGLCGSIGAGKDTVTDGLVSELGYVRLSFAYCLKRTASTAFPWIPERHFFGTQKEKAEKLFRAGDKWITGRKILEELGQSAREIVPDVWVRAAMMGVDSYPNTRWVITDVRHPNEFQAIRDRGGVVWEVVRIGGPEAQRTGHVSDEAWRKLRMDGRVSAPHGQVDELQAAACRLARSWYR